mgnify:CR=1 FL=1
MNKEEKLSPKVEALYKAVIELLLEGREIRKMKVSEITERAGIGKGTAYEYFKSREELLMDALNHCHREWMVSIQSELSRCGGFMEKMSCLFELLDDIMARLKKEALEEICNIFFFYPIFRREGESGMIGRLYEIVREAKRGGELKEEFPDEYIVLVLSGKLFDYITYYVGVKENIPSECTPEQIRGYLLESIRREVVK